MRKFFLDTKTKVLIVLGLDLAILLGVSFFIVPQLAAGNWDNLIELIFSSVEDLGLEYSGDGQWEYGGFSSGSLITAGISAFLAMLVSMLIDELEDFDTESVISKLLVMFLNTPLVLLTFLVLGCLLSLPGLGTVARFFSSWCPVPLFLENFGVLKTIVSALCLAGQLVSLAFLLYGAFSLLAAFLASLVFCFIFILGAIVYLVVAFLVFAVSGADVINSLGSGASAALHAYENFVVWLEQHVSVYVALVFLIWSASFVMTVMVGISKSVVSLVMKSLVGGRKAELPVEAVVEELGKSTESRKTDEK